MKRPQKLAVMLVPTPPYEICGLEGSRHITSYFRHAFTVPEIPHEG